jgi:hypothetical protein
MEDEEVISPRLHGCRYTDTVVVEDQTGYGVDVRIPTTSRTKVYRRPGRMILLVVGRHPLRNREQGDQTFYVYFPIVFHFRVYKAVKQRQV